MRDHLYKYYDEMAVINGNVEDTHRDPEAKLTDIGKTFKFFSIKMDSPIPILPTTKHIQKEPLFASLMQCIEQQWEAIKSMDLSQSCREFQIPTNEPFTRDEWLGFNPIHTELHNRQLETMILHL